MMPEKAIYEKYHRKMKELLKTCDMEGFFLCRMKYSTNSRLIF